MEKILRIFESHSDAEHAAREDDSGLTYQDRFDAFMQIMAPYYAASPGFQRVYRVDDFRQRTVCDDWGLRQNKVASGRPKDQLDAIELRIWLDKETGG